MNWLLGMLLATARVGPACSKKKPAKMFYINVPEEEETCTESQLEILLKINKGEYRLLKKKKRSSVWNVYREIARPDGSTLRWRYYCLGCKRVMQSTGGSTSNLRIHKCHVNYLKQDGNESIDAPQSPSAPIQPGNANSRSHFTLANKLSTPAPTTPVPTAVNEVKEFFEIHMDETADYDDDNGDDEGDANLEEECFEKTQEVKQEIRVATTTSQTRPLLQLLTDEETWCDGDIVEVQLPIELDNVNINEQPDQAEEERESEQRKRQPSQTLENFVQNPIQTPQSGYNLFDASALAEAESYSKSWAHAFLKLSEDQKFYAKRSIDELLVLGRLEKLNISTVTALTTNL